MEMEREHSHRAKVSTPYTRERSAEEEERAARSERDADSRPIDTAAARRPPSAEVAE